MKKLLGFGLAAAAGGLAWLIYGTLVEANKLVLERKNLKLDDWPSMLEGFRIGILADLHLRDIYTAEHAARAIELLLAENPDVVILPGDLVGYWKDASEDILLTTLAPLSVLGEQVIVTPGNHDYWSGDASRLAPICEKLGFTFLRNESKMVAGVCWVGIDSANAGVANPAKALDDIDPDEATIVIWHEPDMVDALPKSAQLMIAGHSHGGQWVFPNGWQPMGTKFGSKYVAGYFPNAPTPLYVSRGLATTGPPARFGSLPEVSLLTIS